ncbi:MAG: GNAT family N-acetyltransferase [Pseudomonadota bacterium]|uniref:GNAT family N-acetyltransferase n=1 Tax=Candidatus Desulfatibia profunda TaxID=2841695 RepID=A0A8J6NV07_9BACT|nr:GNAT family N-acetyltransferase [Candidatus Desulfatibia profunda]MBL7180395.1 GNAT family N-acetyltransferase [Desulfobacterales bacterium]
MFDLNNYRKEVKLRDGTKVLLRPMVAEDKDALYEFFKKVPKEEARYLRDDVSNRLLVEKWAADIDYTKTLPVLAIKDDAIIADTTLNRRRFGWKWHLGTVRIFVHKDYRKVGLGRLMIEEISDIADKLGLEKLIVEIPDTNIAAINAFEKAKFYRVAVIPDLVKDRENRPIDVVVMIKDVKPIYVEELEYDLL